MKALECCRPPFPAGLPSGNTGSSEKFRPGRSSRTGRGGAVPRRIGRYRDVGLFGRHGLVPQRSHNNESTTEPFWFDVIVFTLAGFSRLEAEKPDFAPLR